MRIIFRIIFVLLLLANVPAQIYWGYYPVNPDKMVNDPIVEKGWNIFTNTAL